MATDQDAVRQLVLAGLRERWGREFEDGHNPDLDDIGAKYVNAGVEVVVAERNGSVVAVGMLVREQAGGGRIVRMSVDATYRRRGLGRQIVGELIRRARRQGMRTVAVSTDTPWLSAVKLYESCGFVLVARDPSDTHFSMTL